MNPIFQQSNGASQLAQLYRQYQANPMAVLGMLNPQMRQVFDMAKGNPEQAFRTLARQRGIDPDQFIQMIRGAM